ncbi:MAG TPA: DUF3943 domain-containing protein [Gemmatimonadales bacterium]|nr:DUF3943 domain-containing protein [Gemmatimonadales bacterium]
MLAISLLVTPRAGESQTPADLQTNSDGPHFWQAAAGVAVANLIPWAHNAFIADWPWARVGTRSWGENLRRGLVWDDNTFHVNNFSHPYHGSVYHNSARGSGFGFWASVPFVAAGSATWEFFGETITASLNDLVTTTLGGVALGEVTYRLSMLLRSNRARTGFGRELGAFALSPMARTQGLLHEAGETSRILGESRSTEPAQLAMGRYAGQTFIELAVRYGNPFDPGALRPYDMFELRFQLSPHSSEVIQHVAISGLLTRTRLNRTKHSELMLGVFQHYDLDDLPALQTSGYSVSAALLYRRAFGARMELDLSAHAEGLLLGSITSEQGNYWRRDYDMGPGAGARLGVSLVRDGHEWLRADGRLLWLHSAYGSGGDHVASFLRLKGAIPLLGPVGIGGDVAVTTRHSSFPAAATVRRRVEQLRAYLTWAPH